jgi:membrane protease subunit HflC
MLNRLRNPLLLIFFIVAIGAFAFSYTVRFTETAVVTTFGAAGAGAVKDTPGFYLKWPYPVQSVTKYDRRVRVVQTRSETQQTADSFQIIVEAYLTYRVADPLEFFKRFSSAGDRPVDHVRKAEDDVLRDRLRTQLGEISKFRMNELFAAQRDAGRLPELEARVAELMRTGGGFDIADYGIEIVSVGIDRVILPAETTAKVMERMGASRDRLAQRYQSEGESVARAIRAEAEAGAEKIRAFARRRAAEIEAKGYQEAAPFLAQQRGQEDFAVFLRGIDLMKDAMAKRMTFVFTTSDFGMNLFSPDVQAQLQAGRVPIVAPRLSSPALAAPAGGAARE